MAKTTNKAKQKKESNQVGSGDLYRIAKEKFYKVYDFDPGTKKSDMKWIRVGKIDNVNRPIKWNFFDGKRLLSDRDFDKADVFCKGRAVVTLDKKSNVLKDDGTTVFEKWYDSVLELTSGYGYIVEEKQDECGLNRVSAFADYDGNIVSEWFRSILPMLHGNLYTVARSTGKGVLDKVEAVYDFSKRETISDWYDSISMYIGTPKCSHVKHDGKYNLLDTSGNPVFPVWSVRPVSPDKNGKCQLFELDGKAYNADASTGELEEIK